MKTPLYYLTRLTGSNRVYQFTRIALIAFFIAAPISDDGESDPDSVADSDV